MRAFCSMSTSQQIHFPAPIPRSSREDGGRLPCLVLGAGIQDIQTLISATYQWEYQSRILDSASIQPSEPLVQSGVYTCSAEAVLGHLMAG